MMNDNQIKKLMKKAGRKVEEKFNKIAEQERKQALEQERERNKHLELIRGRIIEIQNENPKRGPCICEWRKFLYGVKNNKVFLASLTAEDEGSLERIKTIDGKQFFLFSQAAFDETNRSLHWMSEHYAEIKIALAKLNPSLPNKDSGGKLFEMYKLGRIYEEFQKEFPGKSIFYFKDCLKALDQMMQERCKNTEI
jgi:hypothetical protein